MVKTNEGEDIDSRVGAYSDDPPGFTTTWQGARMSVPPDLEPDPEDLGVTKRTYDDWDTILYHLPSTPDGDRIAEIIRKAIHAPTVVSSSRTLIPIELSEADTEAVIEAEMTEDEDEEDYADDGAEIPSDSDRFSDYEVLRVTLEYEERREQHPENRGIAMKRALEELPDVLPFVNHFSEGEVADILRRTEGAEPQYPDVLRFSRFLTAVHDYARESRLEERRD